MPVNDLDILAGELRHRIRLEKLSTQQDETGGQIRQWGLQYEVHAKIEPVTGRELDNAAQIYPNADTRFTLRWIPELPLDALALTSWRIVDPWGNQYDIVSVADVETRHIKFDILAVQRLAGRNA